MIEAYILGVVWGTLVEWLLHRYILHVLTSKIKAKFHLEHHRFAAQEEGADHDYFVPLWKSEARLKEVGALFLITALHAPTLLIAPAFFIGNISVVFAYYVLHHLSHRYVEFGWRWMPWHMEHHLITAKGNFGVITPFWDYVFGTRITQRKKG